MKNKKTITVNFEGFGPGFENNNNFFTNLLGKKYNLVITENPDYLFCSVYDGPTPPKNIDKIGRAIAKISPSAYYHSRKAFSKVLAMGHGLRKNKKSSFKGVRIYIASEHTMPDMKEYDWAFGSHFDEEVNSSRYMRILPYVFNDYNLKQNGNPPLKRNINMKKIQSEKTKFCNFLYSQDVPARNQFFKVLSQYKKVDAPGRCMNNMPPIKESDPKKSRLSNNWINDKLAFLKPYKFTIAYENTSLPGWVTEKLTHPMLVNSIPIYFGNKAVSKDFNTKSFINANDFSSMKEVVEHIEKVDTDDELYKKYIKESWYPKNKYSKDIHTTNEKILKQFEKIFGG